MRYIPAIIIAIAIVLAPIVWHVGTLMRSTGPSDAPPAIDSSARIQLADMQVEIAELRLRLGDMQREVASLRAELRSRPTAQPVSPSMRQGAVTGIDTSAYADVVLIGDRRQINQGLTVATSAFLIELFGAPRETINGECQTMMNPELRAMLEVKTVGPIRVQMLRPAIESLERVFERIRLADQELYDRIDTAGSLCVRYIRGSTRSLSAHAFGTAVDLNINGQLDTLGDGRTQLGLTILADFFRDEGWIWGAAFGREDSMHFEVSRELLEQWREAGEI